MTDASSPADIERKLGSRLAARVQEIRRGLALSLDDLARRSGLSKGTVVGIENGRANPSIGVLCRLAASFGISVSDLLDESFAQVGKHPIERMLPTVLWTSSAGGMATLSASLSGSTMFELWSWTLMPGDIYRSDAHGTGTRELISVQSGVLTIEVGDDRLTVGEGGAARLLADRSHAYHAAGSQPVYFTMAVLERGGDA